MRWLTALAWTCLLGCSALACSSSVSSADANEVPGPEVPWPQLDVHETGPGWRIVDGVYEGLETRLRIPGDEDWTPFVGGGLASLTTDIHVGLRHEQLDITIALQCDPYSPRSANAPEDVLELLRAEPLGRSATVKLVGAELELDAGADRLHTYLFGSHWIDDVGIHVAARYPAEAEHAASEAAIREVLARIELLDAGELDELAGELARGPDSQNAIDERWLVRRGVYRNFEHGIEWRMSSPLWAINPRPVNTSLIALSERHLVARLNVFPAAAKSANAEQLHQIVMSSEATAGAEIVAPQHQLPLGAAVARIETLRFANAGDPMLFALATIRHGELAVMTLVGGAEPVATRRFAELDAAIAGLRVDVVLEPESVRDGLFVDLHAGFALRPPARSSMASQQLALGQWSRERSWSTGQESVTVIALHWTGTREDLHAAQAQVIDHIERSRSLASSLSRRAPTQPKTLELGGELGYHRSWIDGKFRDDVVIANRDRTLYLLHVRGRGPELFEHTLQSFEWVD